MHAWKRGGCLAGSWLAAASVLAAEGPGPEAAANGFASRLYGAVAARESGNFVVSPLSAHQALSMVAAGAAADTENQMTAGLGLPPERGLRADAMKSLCERLAAVARKGEVTLEVANRVWAQKTYPVLPAFIREVEDIWGAGFAAADFAGQAETVRAEINGWVEKQTHDRIRDLIAAGMLTPLTRMVLVNAVYFYGLWEEPFDQASTKSEPFHVAADRDIQTDLMHNFLEHAPYREDKTLKVCELPYKGGDLTMVVLLPPAGGLPALEARVAREGFDAVCGALPPRPVMVTLPRFKLEAQFQLNDPLKELGMADMFDIERADFSGITGTRDLYVGAVIQKAFIEVNEKGTEAAAATAVIMPTGAAPMEQPADFRADRPFLFALRDRRTGLVLFLGRVVQP